MEDLRVAIDLVEKTKQALLDACRAALAALRRTNPQLAKDIGSFWSKDDVAAQWFCRTQGSGMSPAELVLAGKADMVRGMIIRAEHGFVG